MKNVVDIKKGKKTEIRKYLMYILFVIILIYILYAIYLLVKAPTDTFTIESGTLTQEESGTRSYNKRRDSNKRWKLQKRYNPNSFGKRKSCKKTGSV